MEAQEALTKIKDLVEAPEVKTEVSSKQFTLNWKDALKGLLIAVGVSVITVIQTSIESGNFHFDWPAIAKVAGASALAYLVKNFFQPAQMKTTVTNAQVDQLKGAETTSK